MHQVAALFVEGPPRGAYTGLPDVDPWDRTRDARLYPGPWPVVAHPPCQRWSRLAGLVEARYGIRRGEDGKCFAAALQAVRMWGGVLEHPTDSAAWRHFGLTAPPRSGGWVRADSLGWTCCVEQGNYGHRARKATWLYAVGCQLPALIWGRADGVFADVSDFARTQARDHGRSYVEILPKRERAATPLPFRDVLLAMARSVHRPDGQPIDISRSEIRL